MTGSYIIGFPRIGKKRELKKALEKFWSKKINKEELEQIAKKIRQTNWEYQKQNECEYISSNDFSFYDQMLDMCILLGAIPERFKDVSSENLYFTMARGDANHTAMEMTKWLNTNYHYLVPELSNNDQYEICFNKIEQEYLEAKELGIKTKINLIGPLSFLLFANKIDEGSVLNLFDKILNQYQEIIKKTANLDDEIIIQLDEPAFVKDPTEEQLSLLKKAYETLASISPKVKIFVATYFDHATEAVKVLSQTPIYGLVLDFVYGPENLEVLNIIADNNKKLVCGIVDGKNIWISNINEKTKLLEQINQVIPKENLLIGTSCSLQHVPYSLETEQHLDSDLLSWLAFALEKLAEIRLINKLFFQGKENLSAEDLELLEKNQKAINLRQNSEKINNPAVINRVKNLMNSNNKRSQSYEERIKVQRKTLNYPLLPTTTIGSFPQTPEIRKTRKDFKNGQISIEEYESKIKSFIDECIIFQEEIDIDILVHGESERNDMVEYFGEQLEGFAFTKNGWVQSYGSRCVKPPIIYGDVSRPTPMTVKWISYAQSKTEKIMKGMLTGPTTILNWSFVRDDQTYTDTALQVACAISDEVVDLQKAGIKIIQIDEAALKEGYPLRKSKKDIYEKMAVEGFLISAKEAQAETQIHTHMCYSHFDDIFNAIKAMDSDVITIETARSGNRLLKIFKKEGYSHEIGPGIYDIHSPRIPSIEEMETEIKKRTEVLDVEQIWINPDCGLKTRKWDEVKPSLKNMVEATKKIRKTLS